MKMRVAIAVACLAAFAGATAALAAGYRLAPWKDDLFKYPAILDSRDGGALITIDYSKERDLYGRDAVVEKQAKPEYVERVGAKTYSYKSGFSSQKMMGAGKVEGGAKAIVIYIHGMGGSRHQGVDEGMFGGNFNRIMNLMVRNGGTYLSPDYSPFGGAGQIRDLIVDQAKRSPGAPIFVACGSWGGTICWELARDPKAAPLIGGLLLLGSNHDDRFVALAQSGAVDFPVYLGHGTEDPIYGWKEELAFYRKVRAAAPNYPIRLALFETGVHGTPIRMTDWRQIVNWMLEVNEK